MMGKYSPCSADFTVQCMIKSINERMHEFKGWETAHAPGLCWNLCSLGSSLRKACSPFVRKCSWDQNLCGGGKMKGVKEV